MRKIILLVFLCGLILFSSSCNNSNSDYGNLELISTLNSEVPKLLSKYNGKAISIALIDGGNTVWSKGYGYADIENKTEASSFTVYQAASISKPVTVWAVMKLVEDGLLDLDEPIGSYLSDWVLPESEYDNNEVTTRRILSHTAGLSLGGFRGLPPENKIPSLPEALSGNNSGFTEVKVFKEPGLEFDYSGGGYMLLSLLVEEISGISFEEYIYSNILSPLGMNNSNYLQSLNNPKMAKPYNTSGTEIPNYIYSGKGAASLYTSVNDLAILVGALTESSSGCSKGRDILNPSTINEMIAPVTPLCGDIGLFYDSMALGYFADKTGMISHTGSNRGWRSFFGIYPEEGNGLVILTNSDTGRNIYIEIIDIWSKMKGYKTPKMVKFFNKVFSYSLIVLLSLFACGFYYLFKMYKSIRKRERIRIWHTRIIPSKIILRSISHLIIPVIFALVWSKVPSTILAQLSPLTYKWLFCSILLWVFILILMFLYPKMNTEKSNK